MISSVCAGILLLSALSCSLACPFFLGTSRGILALHWTIANYLVSSSEFFPICSDGRSLLIPLATLFLLTEQAITVNGPEYTLSPIERLLLWTLLVSLDCICVLFGHSTETSLLLFLSLAFLALSQSYRNIPEPMQLSEKERLSLGSSDLFIDSQNGLACLGRLGTLHFLSILASMIVQIPLLREIRLVVWLLYVSRSVCTLSLLFTPAFFGGSVHVLKTAGAKIANQRKKNKGSGDEMFRALVQNA